MQLCLSLLLLPRLHVCRFCMIGNETRGFYRASRRHGCEECGRERNVQPRYANVSINEFADNLVLNNSTKYQYAPFRFSISCAHDHTICEPFPIVSMILIIRMYTRVDKHNHDMDRLSHKYGGVKS